MTLPESESPVDQEEAVEILLPNTTIVTHCILRNDIPRLTKSFEDDTDPFKENIAELINERDCDGKAPLDISATLGRVEMTRELLQRGADVNSTTSKGIHQNLYFKKLHWHCFRAKTNTFSGMLIHVHD